jgi:hypothetical protein
MWRHVPWVANGLTVQGGLELLTAGLLLLGAMDSDSTPPSTLYDTILLRVAPGFLLAAGSLKALAGWRNRGFRGRALGLVALWSAVPAGVAWMCSPSGLALLVYGSIVYHDRTSRRAFALGDGGKTLDEVIALSKATEPE